jgi:uncharacterized protein (TIGR00725 family)
LLQIAIVGGGSPPSSDLTAAFKVGESLARLGAVVVCGGLGGVMEAACRGAKSAGGLTIGILPGSSADRANPWVDVAIPTGMGEARNALVVASCQAVIAIGGEYGTLSEIALALRAGKPVIGLSTWSMVRPDGAADAGIVPVASAEEAAELAVGLGGA